MSASDLGIDIGKAKMLVPIAVIVAVLISAASFAMGLATERGQITEKVDRLERDIAELKDETRPRLIRLERTVNRIEAMLEQQQMHRTGN